MLRLFLSVFGEFQTPPIGLEYELQCVESFLMDPLDANIFKRCQGRRGRKKVVQVTWTWLELISMWSNCSAPQN